jgi:hypothetical protein
MGLEQLLVGAVIIYHTQINILGHQPFKSGFIGVDIFFVISGYLITSIILKELVTTGTFSLTFLRKTNKTNTTSITIKSVKTSLIYNPLYFSTSLTRSKGLRK